MKYSSNVSRSVGFTLIELLIITTIVGILSLCVFIIIRPQQHLEQARVASATESLQQVAKAAQMYANDNDAWAPDVNRSIPSEFSEYINPSSWAKAPWPGSVFDYDNWLNQTCWDGTTGNLQVTIRQINGYKGKTNYTMYYVIKGQGVPHCSDSSARGECINCISRYP